MKLDVLLRLGRVSNLPTVLSNVMAGMVLAGGNPKPFDIASIGVAAASLYVGGMFLNDAFDAEIDGKERPERPIPSGEISRRTVFLGGFAFLALGVATVAGHGAIAGGMRAVMAALATCALIVVYNAWHKGNPAAPVVMGLCRVGVYATAGLAVSSASTAPQLLTGCALLLAYVVGLTYVARFESGSSRIRRWWPLLGLFAPIVHVLPVLGRTAILPFLAAGFAVWVVRGVSFARRGGGSIKAAVGSLIAGIALVDAMLIASRGAITLSFAAIAMFGLTLAFHRRVAGT